MERIAIAKLTAKDSGLAKGYLNRAQVNCLSKLNQKSKVSEWYTSADDWAAKKLLDSDLPPLEECINYEPNGQKWYWGLVMLIRYYPGMDDQNHADRLHTISPSVQTCRPWHISSSFIPW